MAGRETAVSKNTQMEASKHGSRLFRNNRGMFYTMTGQKTRAGLEADGASDLVGGTPVLITQDMVGKTVCVLTVAECKVPEWKGPRTEIEKKQLKFINFVKSMGGIGFFINNHEDFKLHIDSFKKNL